MTADEYETYLQRINDLPCSAARTLVLQIELSVLRYVELAAKHGVTIDRDWFERRLAASVDKSST